MKKNILLAVFCLVLCAMSFAQVPQMMSYQAVVRGSDNNLVVNQQISIRVSILQGSADGGAVYTETHSATTNANGLVSIEIGNGTSNDDFSTINWANGPYFVKTETDVNGGENYEIVGVSQLLSVPYAMYAQSAGNMPDVSGFLSEETDPQFNAWDKDYNDLTNRPEIPTVPTNVSAFENDANYLTSYTETDPQFNAWDKDYNDLTNRPEIPIVPTNVSAFENDANYIADEMQSLTDVLAISNSANDMQIKNVANPTENQDAVTKKYVDEIIATLQATIDSLSFVVQLGGHAFVDLGLPSGTLWATCNVGASRPEDYGNYYAWGEITGKDIYEWNTYRYCNGTASTLTKYCSNANYGNNGFIDNLTTLQSSDDVASANWGNGWRMPTETEMRELIDNCTYEWSVLNGVNGVKFTGTNGNSIFLPAAGYRNGDELRYVGTDGNYVTSSRNATSDYYKVYLSFQSEILGIARSRNRCYGESVRPIYNPNDIGNSTSEPLDPSQQEYYTVTFNANGGSGTMSAQTFTSGIAQTLNTNTFTKTGYNFAGWNTSANGNGTAYTNGQSVTITSNLTLYAQWSLLDVQTLSAVSITVNTATIRGNISNDGGSNVTVRGFIYGTSPNELTQNVQRGSGTGSYQYNLISLSPSTTYYYKAYATNSMGTVYGEVMQFTTLDGFVDSRDGMGYTTITIGSQTWMGENLRYTGNSASITILGSNAVSTTARYRYYPNGNFDNVRTYGYLYNWLAAKTACPDGWHLPTNAEWTQLANYLGTSTAGAQLAGGNWNSGSLTASSMFGSSGFNALPAGEFNTDFSGFGHKAYFWTATEGSTSLYAQARSITNTNTILVNHSSSSAEQGKEIGFSVRCVRNN